MTAPYYANCQGRRRSGTGSSPVSHPKVSILIPAYNEAAVIARTLRPLLVPGRPDYQVIVIANGCSDDTAQVAKTAVRAARADYPGAARTSVQILDLPEGSKTAALNAGADLAEGDSLVFLDADIGVRQRAVDALVAALDCPVPVRAVNGGPADQNSARLQEDDSAPRRADLAYGRAQFRLSDASPLVRAFYRAWWCNPYFDDQKMGGFFALSRAAARRLLPLPAITNDDEYIRRHLQGRSVFAASAPYRIDVPRSLDSLSAVRRRVLRGNAELQDAGVRLDRGQTLYRALVFLMRLLCRPTLWGGAAVFFYVAASVRFAAAVHGKSAPSAPGQAARWERDHSTRSGACGTGHSVPHRRQEA